MPQRLAYPEQIAAAFGNAPAVLIASPALLKRLPETLDWRPAQASLRAVFSSGGPLPASAAAQVHALWRLHPVEVLGSTETGGIASRQGSDHAWAALPGVEWRLDGDILEVRSPHLADRDWYRSEDRAAATTGGFSLLGRADRIVKIEERRISLSAIEARLLASPWLEEVRLVPLPGRRMVLAAVAVPSAAGRALIATDGSRTLGRQLRDFLSDHVDAIAIPKRWRFVPSMPADSQGKTSDRALVGLFAPNLPEPMWLERDANKAILLLDVVPGLSALDGHFPAMSLLPGVAMLDWAILFAREAFALPESFAGMDGLKFQQMVRPGTRVELNLDWQPATGALRFRYTSSTGVHASGRVLFSRRENQA